MKRTIAFALLALAIPVASDAQVRSNGPAQDAEVNVRMRGFRERILLDTVAVWNRVPGPGPQTFRNALRVLDSLGVPIAYADSIRGVIHHGGFVARGRLAGKSVSNSLRCGMGLAGDYADSWRVSIAYAVFVRPDGEHSSLGVALIAAANDVEGVSKPAVQCASTGLLEGTLHKTVGLRAIQ